MKEVGIYLIVTCTREFCMFKFVGQSQTQYTSGSREISRARTTPNARIVGISNFLLTTMQNLLKNYYLKVGRKPGASNFNLQAYCHSH